MRATHIFLFTFLCYFSALASQSDIYLYFDTECIDRYEYITMVKEGRNVSQNDYFTFHIKINNNERVVLNTDGKSNSIANLPNGTKYCGDIVVSESFARLVNNKEAKLFLVTSRGAGYNLMDIHSADYFFTTDAEMGYATKDYSFAYNYSTKAKGNLASKESKGKVYYRERDDKFCPSEYTFRRTPRRNHNPYNDITLVPDVGITEKKTGLDAATANNNVLRLVSVNGIPLSQYMDAVCNGYVEYLSKNVTENTKTSNPTADNTNTTKGGSTKVPPSTGKITPTGTCSHIYKDLDRGFYFDRNTGLRMDGTCGGLTYVNGLIPGTYKTTDGSSTTSTNTTPVVTTTTSTTPTTTVSVSSCSHLYKDLDRGLYINRNTGQPANEECGGNVYKNGNMVGHSTVTGSELATQPTAPAQSGTIITPTSTPPTTTSPSDDFTARGGNIVHIVAKKETLYSISKRYGISVADVKAWNGMSSNTLTIGQTLKVSAPASSTTSPVITSKGTEVITAPTTTARAAVIHTVKKNETLYSISKKHNVTIDALKSYNGLSNNTLSIGQVLIVSPATSSVTPSSYETIVEMPSAVTIPEDYVAPASTTTVSSSVPSSYSYDEGFAPKGVDGYVTPVKVKDHLSEYTKGRLVHIVEGKETLYSIATKYGVNVDVLRSINNLDKNEVIIPAQKLYITE